MTPLFQKYIEMGLVCTNIEWVLEYYPKDVFKWFVDSVGDTRRKADLDPAFKIRGETAKTKGNAVVGITMMDKSRHLSIKYCTENNISRHTRTPLFKSFDELENGVFEVEKSKKTVTHDSPLQIGIAVYSYAKLSLICFWEFLNKFLENDLYELLEMDTDSLYIAFARDTIDECVKPELKDEWEVEKHKFFSSNSTEPVEFDGQTITLKQYDKRTPGKFKPEFVGDGMISLNSKVYHCWCHDPGCDDKTSCKGVQQGRNLLVKDDFLGVLDNPRNRHMVQNSGFIRHDDEIRTYTQEKKGLEYFYGKRIVQDDGVSTAPLEI